MCRWPCLPDAKAQKMSWGSHSEASDISTEDPEDEVSDLAGEAGSGLGSAMPVGGTKILRAPANQNSGLCDKPSLIHAASGPAVGLKAKLTAARVTACLTTRAVRRRWWE